MKLSAKVPPDDEGAKLVRFEDVHGQRYTEIFLIGGHVLTRHLVGGVYNTIGLNDPAGTGDTSPQDILNKVDVDALEEEYDLLRAFKNGPRLWCLDWIEAMVGKERDFSGLHARWVTWLEYRDRMRRAAGMGTLGAWYDQLEAGMLLNLVREEVQVKQLDKKEARRAEKHVAQAYGNDSTQVSAKRTAEVGGELRIVADPPLIVPLEDLAVPGTEWEDPAPLIMKLLASYRRTLGHQGHPLEEFRYVHAARKVVGVGSVGTRCYVLLLIGRDHDDPLFLQVKEAQASVLEPYAGRSAYPHHGQRVVMGQRLMQAAGDIFLGWQRINGTGRRDP